MDKIRRHIVFRGYVQGVGFRYRAYHTARTYGISGWVRNCSDGSVEMEAEGTKRDIDDLLIAIEKHPWAQIDDIRCTEIPLQNDTGFEIRS